MDINDEKMREAVEYTEILRTPKWMHLVLGISSVSRTKMFKVGSLRVDMGNPGLIDLLTMIIGV